MVTVTKRSANGLAEPSALPGQRSTLTPPRIERWVDVPDYPGYRVKLWVNYPRALTAQLSLPDGIEDLEGEALEREVAQLKATLEQTLNAIVLEHNGWPDEDGNVLPQPSSLGFWDQLDQHLAAVVSTLARQAPGQLPNSLQPMKRR